MADEKQWWRGPPRGRRQLLPRCSRMAGTVPPPGTTEGRTQHLAPRVAACTSSPGNRGAFGTVRMGWRRGGIPQGSSAKRGLQSLLPSRPLGETWRGGTAGKEQDPRELESASRVDK